MHSENDFVLTARQYDGRGVLGSLCKNLVSVGCDGDGVCGGGAMFDYKNLWSVSVGEELPCLSLYLPQPRLASSLRWLLRAPLTEKRLLLDDLLCSTCRLLK